MVRYLTLVSVIVGFAPAAWAEQGATVSGPATTETAARALVEGWAAAINRDDRDAYLDCYAPSLRDDSNISGMPERIEVTVVRVSRASGTANQRTDIVLIERRRSGGGWVLGERRLVVDTSGATPRIIRQDNLRQVWSLARSALDRAPREARDRVLRRASSGYRGVAGRDDPARRSAERRARINDQVARVGLLRLIGSRGSDGEVVDVLRGGGPSSDIDEVLARSGGGRVAPGGKGIVRGGASGDEAAGGVAIIGPVKTSSETETRLRGKVKRAPLRRRGGSGSLEEAEARRVIGRSLGAIKTCYERVLSRAPTLTGRIDVLFTVNQSGRVQDPALGSNTVDPAVGSCVLGRIRTLRFSPPQGGTVTFEQAFFFQPAD